jgi:hypothetical protein
MKEADMELWAKPLISVNSGKVAVALLNRSGKPATMSFELKTVGIDAAKGYVVRDLWEKKDSDKTTSEKITMTVPSHGVTVLKITGKSIPFNVFQKGKI